MFKNKDHFLYLKEVNMNMEQVSGEDWNYQQAQSLKLYAIG